MMSDPTIRQMAEQFGGAGAGGAGRGRGRGNNNSSDDSMYS